MLLCVEDLCFSNIPSKTDLYKYYCHRFSLGKYLRDKKKIFDDIYCLVFRSTCSDYKVTIHL
jgi:hypothetical protein